MRKFLFVILIFGLVSCEKEKESNETTLGLQQFGDFPTEIKDSIQSALEKEYGFQIINLPKQEMPEAFFVNLKSPRYRADKIIKHLRYNTDSLDYVLGLTSFDISTTKKDNYGRVKKPKHKYEDWGIFGLGYLGAKGAVISDFRTKKTSKEKYISRMQKIAIHEIGHNLGLPHCENKSCVMTDAVETINTVDNAEKTLCEKCKQDIE